MAKLRFGYFIAPFHRAGTNPTLALQRDLEFVEHLDALGYDEAWIGEHHSAGTEIISSPEVFIAAAAQRAPRIRFGTGVISLSYHNPLWVADRLMLLDHLTHGRVIGGMGPGSLPTDSAMIGLSPTDTRELLETNLDIVVRLLAGESVTAKTATHELIDARLQLAPYSDGGIPLAVAAVASPTGARLAGKHGIGLLSIGATLIVDGFDALAHHWGIVEERAAAFGTRVDRGLWTLVGPFHVAETDEQARADVRFGIEAWFRYFQKVAAFPQMTMPGDRVDEMIDVINNMGAGVIGTPERARAQVQRLWDQSGGFGCMLQMGHEWANPAATKRSAELFAAEVMPHFQGQAATDAGRRPAGRPAARRPRPDSAECDRTHDQEVRSRESRELTDVRGRRRVVYAGLQGLIQSVSGQPSTPAISSYIVAPSMDSRMMSACPAWRDSSSMRCRATQRTDQSLHVLGEPRHVVRDRNRCVQIGLGEDPQRLGVLRLQRLQQLVEGFVVTHHVLVLVGGHRALDRPGIRRREFRRRRGPLRPAALHSGGVLDQTADRQRAHRRLGPRLLVGQPVGHREERVLLEGEELEQGLAFVGGGRGHSGHR